MASGSGSGSFILSGNVVDDAGDPRSGITVTLDGSNYYSNPVFVVVTNAAGDFSQVVAAGWAGTVTPTSTEFAFVPTAVTIPAVTAHVSDINFVASPLSNFFKIVRSITTGVPGRTQAYRMVATITEADGIDKNLFLYHRMTLEPVSGTTGDFFRKIASPTDIEEYPVGAPDPQSPLPFYRLDSVDMLFRSADLLNETWEMMLADLRELGRTMTAISRLQAGDINIVKFEGAGYP